MTRLRPARPDDADPCSAILREWIAQTSWFPRPDPPQAAPAFMAAKIAHAAVILAEDADTTLGFTVRDGDYLSCLYIACDARGQGLGRRLLDRAKADSPEGRLRLWTFQANLGAQRFYLREGFAETRRTEGAANDEGLPDIEFTWSAGARR